MIQEKPARSKKVSLLVYLLLANGITWAMWMPALIIGGEKGYIMPNFDTMAMFLETGYLNAEHKLLGTLFQLAVYGPLAAAVVATWMDRGREGLADLWRRIVRWRVAGRWYLAAILITASLAGVPVVVFGLIGSFTPGWMSLSYVLFMLASQLLTSGLGEEPGWRGYLMPRLKEKFPGEKYVWVLGLIWAIWHYPFVILQTMSMMQDVTTAQLAVTILTSLAGMTMSQIGLTYIFAWLYNRTESVFLMIVFHALSNVISTWMVSYLPEPQAVSLFVGLMPWVLVIILQRRLGKEAFPG